MTPDSRVMQALENLSDTQVCILTQLTCQLNFPPLSFGPVNFRFKGCFKGCWMVFFISIKILILNIANNMHLDQTTPNGAV